MTKLDLKKFYSELLNPPKDRFVEIEVPTMIFVQVDGAGGPNTAREYKTAVEWPYGASYTMKFAAKESLQRDYVVPPLEALWLADDPQSFIRREKDRCQRLAPPRKTGRGGPGSSCRVSGISDNNSQSNNICYYNIYHDLYCHPDPVGERTATVVSAVSPHRLPDPDP